MTAHNLQKRKYEESASVFSLVKVFFQCILTSNVHINCLILWFTKAIICCTSIISCISPVDVCYSQHLSFLHHTSISLVPRLLFSPSDVWFWYTLIILLTWLLHILWKPCTYKWNSHMLWLCKLCIQEQSLNHNLI